MFCYYMFHFQHCLQKQEVSFIIGATDLHPFILVQDIHVCMFQYRLVRLTSPNLNYFIIAGAVIFYSSVYTFFYVPQTSLEVVAIVCNVSRLNSSNMYFIFTTCTFIVSYVACIIWLLALLRSH